jgi:hypothetical protein
VAAVSSLPPQPATRSATETTMSPRATIAPEQ